MGTLTAFHYRAGNSTVHTLDTRIKLVLMALTSLVVLNATEQALLIFTGSLVFLLFYSQVPMASAFRELRYFMLLLIIVFCSRVWSTPGEPLVQIGSLTISKTGLFDGAIVCWRFLLVVVLGLLFVSTTRIAQIKKSVAWFLSPIPWVPERRVATMMGLVVRFIPDIFYRAGEVSAAQHARCVSNRKNPLYRLKTFSLPLFRGIFKDADNLAAAMEARCYAEDVARPMAKATPKDWLTLSMGCGYCLILRFM